MLNENNEIIIVDDVQDDLDRLAAVFHEKGIGCRAFRYDGIEFPQSPLLGVRMAFFDLHLIKGVDDMAQYTTLADALKKYISPSNPYFILILWTKNAKEKESFIKFARKNTSKDIPSPLKIITLDKLQFTDENKNLENKLGEIFDDFDLKSLFYFGDDVQEAAMTCFDEILRLVERCDKWGENDEYMKQVKKLFSAIAIEMMGLEHAKKKPGKGIKEALAPIFLHELLKKDDSNWNVFLDSKSFTKDTSVLEDGLKVKLNKFFNIDLNTEEKDARGSVRVVNIENETFNKCFSVNSDVFKEKMFVDGTMNKTEYDTKSVKIIALEVSAACDYAQNKTRLHKYILGVLFSGKKDMAAGDYIYELPFDFNYDGKTCSLALNFNYTFNEEDSETNKILGEKLFSLKENCLNCIISEYANHISRLGFTCFRKKPRKHGKHTEK